MKIASVCLGLLIAFAGSDVLAQALPLNTPPNLQIMKHSWSKDRINWEGNPLVTPVESYRETTYRIRNERQIRTPLEERTRQANREGQKQPTEPPRYAFSYKLQVSNVGNKAIKEIDWDYVFTDETTGEEFGRRQFTSVEKVNPGKRKELVVRASAAPTSRVSVYSLGKDERAGLVETIIITRLLYDDDTTWVPPELKRP